MPEDASHMLKEDTNSTVVQTFDSTAASAPSQQQIDRHFCYPLDLPEGMETDSHVVPQYKRAPIELLPVEVFDQIFPLLAVEHPTNGYAPRNKDLASCLLVSRTFYAMTLSTLYSHVTFPHSTIYSKFLLHLKRYPELGGLVKRLDFSHFTSVGLGRTKRMNTEIQKLTATTLTECLAITPRVREFLASEALDEDIDERVLTKIFCELPQLVAADFCAATAECFVKGFMDVVSANNPALPEQLSLTRISLHSCTTLPPSVFATLLPRLPRLTHLDLTHTQVTDGSLHAIPSTTKLSHLSLSKCARLNGPAVVDFLVNHPSARSLVFLNLLYDSGRYRLLSPTDVDDLLPYLPDTLRSLNLSGAKISSTHMPYLRRLSTHLEELSVGHAELSMEDINSFFESEVDAQRSQRERSRSNLHYLDLTGIASVAPASLIFTADCPILLPSSYPLLVLELSEKVTGGLTDRPVTGKKLGWEVKAQHRRNWYVRTNPGTLPAGQKIAEALQKKDDARSWKMGGKWWGGRKVGVAEGVVSGIYGYYAFGK